MEEQNLDKLCRGIECHTLTHTRYFKKNPTDEYKHFSIFCMLHLDFFFSLLA